LGDFIFNGPSPVSGASRQSNLRARRSPYNAFFALVTRAFMLLGMVEFFKREDDASAAT
jgi:hypothetical protein